MQEKKQNNDVHHGARFISTESISKLIPGIENVREDIEQFRNVAYMFNQKNKFSNQIFRLAPEKFNNTISILGQRGAGKTSAMMTLIEEIQSGKFFTKSIKKENKIDIIMRIVDPEQMGEGSDLLGWIITALDKYIDNIFNQYDESQYSLSECIKTSNLNHTAEQLKNYIKDLQISYISSKKEYSNLMYSKSNSLSEYTNKFKSMLNYDYDFHNQFSNVITEIINFKRKQNQILVHNIEAEPLIFFFFDDVDTSSKHCPDMLLNILNFLCHPNIVVCVSGDYEIFEHSMTKYLLDNTGFPQKELTDKEIEIAKTRSEFFLKKVLPSTYRYRIVNYKNEILFNLRYTNQDNTDDFQAYNIYQLISYVFKYGFDNNPQKKYLDFLILTKDNGTTEQSEEKNLKYLYAYLSIFGKNVRSFVNVYNYLYIQAKTIQKNRMENKNLKINEYWNIERFNEFINVILDSKFTYLQYRNDINRFLSIKYDKIFSNNHDDMDTTKINDDIRNLRIDCEELELVIIDMLKKEKNNISIDKQSEIDTLIMLPIFLNEIFYCIHKENYETRHERISNKLKDILCKVFLNSLNTSLIIIPCQLDMNKTLCIYYRLISRLNFQSLKSIGKPYPSSKLHYISDTKKYFVQMYFAYLLIDPDNSKTNIPNSKTDNDLYNNYEISTYNDYNPHNNRIQLEKIINKNMFNFFKTNDREWFNDKLVFLNNYCNNTTYLLEHVKDTYFLKKVNNNVKKDLNLQLTLFKKDIQNITFNENFEDEMISLLLDEIKKYDSDSDSDNKINKTLINIKNSINKDNLKKVIKKIANINTNEEIDDDTKQLYEIINDFIVIYKVYLQFYLDNYDNPLVCSDTIIGVQKIFYFLIFSIEYYKYYHSQNFEFFKNLYLGCQNCDCE